MFLRWKRQHYPHTRMLNGRVLPGGMRLTAYLVHSERMNGKPRQRIVAYLCHIREYHPYNIYDRYWFWHGVEGRLAALALPAEQRHQIEAHVHERLPRLTAEERAQLRAKGHKL